MVQQHPTHVGHATLALLVESWSVQILRALMAGPRRPSELEQRLPDVPHSALMRRLGELHDKGLAHRERQSGLNPSASYALTPPGRMILSVTSAAERWERAWGTDSTDGLDALRLIADEPTREILLALATGPCSPGPLTAEVQLSRSPLRQRLAELANRGILNRRGRGSRVTYELTDNARDLMLVAVAAARWEWEWDRPADTPATGNVAHTLRMFAPRAQLPADLGGVCRLHVDDDSNGPDVHLAVAGRRVTALPAPPEDPPRASCHATPRAWCDGLLLRRWEAVISTGDRALMAATLASISGALLS